MKFPSRADSPQGRETGFSFATSDFTPLGLFLAQTHPRSEWQTFLSSRFRLGFKDTYAGLQLASKACDTYQNDRMDASHTAIDIWKILLKILSSLKAIVIWKNFQITREV